MKGWKKGVRKEFICCVTRFSVQSAFTLAVGIILNPVRIPPNHLHKKPTGFLPISLPATHTAHQEGRALPCSNADGS